MACSSHALGLWCARNARRRTLIVLLFSLLFASYANCSANSIWQHASGKSPDKGSADRALRKEAITNIPWQSLSDSDEKLVKHVVSKPTLYRCLPTRLVDCDPQLYDLLLDHPELVVDVWSVMGISKLSVEKVSPRLYHMTDSTGTVGKVRVLHTDQPVSTSEGKVSRLLIYAEGVYEAPPMPRPIQANCVLILKSTANTEANGRTYIQAELDSFIRLDRTGAELILKAINPLVSRTADHNFVETMRFVSLFSRTAETNPDGMERLASHLTKVEEPVRQEFVTVCHQTALRSANRREVRTASKVSTSREVSQTIYR